MVEIAEMMLDGTLCEGCGEYMGDGVGFPMRCSGCEPISVARRKSSFPKKAVVVKGRTPAQRAARAAKRKRRREREKLAAMGGSGA